MPDRIIKPDDTYDLVLSNNHGGAQIDINEDDSIGITGSLPAGYIVGSVSVCVTQATQVTSSGAISELDTDLRLTYTVKSTSNILIFEFYAWICSPNSDNIMWSNFYNVTDTAVPNYPPASGDRKRTHFAQRVSKVDANDFNKVHYLVIDDAPPSGEKVYTIHFGTEGSAVEFYSSTLSTGTGVVAPATFTIKEVQA